MVTHTWKTTSPRSPSAPQVADGNADIPVGAVALAEAGGIDVAVVGLGMMVGGMMVGDPVGRASVDVAVPLSGRALDAVAPGEGRVMGPILETIGTVRTIEEEVLVEGPAEDVRVGA